MAGHGGPAKLWVGGKPRFQDPKGTNPAVPAAKRIVFQATPGAHEIVIVLGSNAGRAGGVFLQFERLDVAPALVRQGPAHYALPG